MPQKVQDQCRATVPAISSAGRFELRYFQFYPILTDLLPTCISSVSNLFHPDFILLVKFKINSHTLKRVIILLMLKPVANNDISARTPANPRNRKYPASRFLLMCQKLKNKARRAERWKNAGSHLNGAWNTLNRQAVRPRLEVRGRSGAPALLNRSHGMQSSLAPWGVVVRRVNNCDTASSSPGTGLHIKIKHSEGVLEKPSRKKVSSFKFTD